MWFFALLLSANTYGDVFSLLSDRIDGKLKIGLGVETEVSERGKDHKFYNFDIGKSIRYKKSSSYIFYAK